VRTKAGTVVAILAEHFPKCEPAHPRKNKDHIPDKGGFEVLRRFTIQGDKVIEMDYVQVYRRIASSEVTDQLSRGDIRREGLMAYSEVLRDRGFQVEVNGGRLFVTDTRTEGSGS
jgi:hypothetical protein